MADEILPPAIHEPLAELEQRLIDEYIVALGEDPDELRARTDGTARRVLTDASLYATARLAEVECRSHYVRQLHGQE